MKRNLLLTILCLTILLTGVCGCKSQTTEIPPPAAHEAPPIEEMLALGEATTADGIKFTVIEYVIMTRIHGELPLKAGYQYLLVRYEAENTTDTTLIPPYTEENILIVYKGEVTGIPSLIFTPTVPLPDGRDANHYTFRTHFSGELAAGISHTGWECYLVPLEFSAADAYVRVTFPSGEKIFWSLGGSNILW